MGPRAGLDGCGKSRPHRDSIPGPSSPSESLYGLCYPIPYFILKKERLLLPAVWVSVDGVYFLLFYPVSCCKGAQIADARSSGY